MKKLISLVLGTGLVIATPVLSSAVTLEGHFSGHATHNGPAPGVYAPGVVYTARMILDTVQVNPWYPWDSTKQYTVVVNAVVDTYTGGFLQVVDFRTGATFRIYEDTATAADWANAATFTDGTLVLSGVSNDMFGQRANIFGLPWNVYGTIVFTSGAGIGNLHNQCAGGLQMNDFIDFQIATNPPGYREAYNAEWKCAEPISVDDASWGSVKAQYR